MTEARTPNQEWTADEVQLDRQGIFPYLTYSDAIAAIDWLGRVFGFEPDNILPLEDGRVAHAVLRCEGAYVMLSSELEQFGNRAPKPSSFETSRVHVHVDDADAHYNRAVLGGAEIVQPLEERFWGLRGYHALDLEGHWWSFYQRVRSVPQEEVRERLLTW